MRRGAISLFCTLIALAIGISAAFQKTKNPRAISPKSGSSTTGHSDVVDCTKFHPYSDDPNHIWNRVHRRLLVRRDAQGKVWGCDEVDPLLWRETQHVLAGPVYRKTVALLDEFTRTHSEKLIRDPVRRAMFQRDLWAVFDWLVVYTGEPSRERTELEKRLASIIKSVALKASEIQHLPDNYRQLRGAFISTSTSDGFALPDSSDAWLMIGRDDAGPVAPIHSFPFSRSLFLVYMKLPPDGPRASAYLESMRTYSRQHPPGEDCQIRPCNPPQFPVGTELALVRRALLMDTSGQPVISPVTESIQLRRYLKIPPRVGIDFDGEMQQVAEFLLSRRALLQGDLSLHRVGESESHFQVFSTHGTDSFERGEKTIEFPALRGCHGCHQGVGVRSFTTYSRAQFETERLFILVHAGNEAQESAAAIAYLQSRDSWKLLKRLMK
jgi:hypothetical protein